MTDIQAKLDAIAQKGDFIRCSLDFKKKLPPTFGCLNSNGNALSTTPNATFWIDTISWTYGYTDTGHPRANITIIQPITVTIKQSLGGNLNLISVSPIFSGQYAAHYVPADHFLYESVDIDISNPNVANFHQLEVNLKLNGTLVSPKTPSWASGTFIGVAGASLSLNEQFYYLENKIRKDAYTNEARVAVCQCSLKTIMSAGCQCGGA